MSCEKCKNGEKSGYQPVYSTYSDYVTKIFNLENKVKKLEEELEEKNKRILFLEGKKELRSYESFVTPSPFRKTSTEPEIVEITEDEPEPFLAPNSPLFKGRKNFKKKSDRNSREISDNELNEGKIEVYTKDFMSPSSPSKGRKHYKWAGSKQTEDEASFENEIQVEEVKKSDEEAEMKFSGKLNQSGRQIQGGEKTVYGEAFENEDGSFGSRVIQRTTSYSTRQRTSSMEATGIITSKLRPETKRSTSEDFDAQGFYDYLTELEGKPQTTLQYSVTPGLKVSSYKFEYEPEIVKAKDHKSPVLSWEVIGQERNVVHAKVVMSDIYDTVGET